jgi:hypothetical protein
MAMLCRHLVGLFPDWILQQVNGLPQMSHLPLLVCPAGDSVHDHVLGHGDYPVEPQGAVQ